jgi:hypothetical protein
MALKSAEQFPVRLRIEMQAAQKGAIHVSAG